MTAKKGPAMPTTPQKQETWRNWLPHTTALISTLWTQDELVAVINEGHKLQLTAEQVQAWEDRGFLPLPIPDFGERIWLPPAIEDWGYPPLAETIVLTLHDLERGGTPLTPEVTRPMLRSMAMNLDKTNAIILEMRFAEDQQKRSDHRETWLEWFPDAEPELTFGELDKHIRETGVEPVTAPTLRAWQNTGLLPYPLRRRHDNAQRALYPRAAVKVIEQVRILQGQGLSLKEIKPLVRGIAATRNDPDPLNIRSALIDAALLQADMGGAPITQVTVTFTDSTGTDTAYQYRVPAGPTPWPPLPLPE